MRREQVRVPEDVAPGTTVARVRAKDRDLGLNGDVEYAFSPLTEAQHGAVFGIRPDSGKIYIKAVGLDHEQSAVSSTEKPFYSVFSHSLICLLKHGKETNSTKAVNQRRTARPAFL